MGRDCATNRPSITEVLGSIQEMAFENQRVKEEIEYLKAHCTSVEKFYAKTMSVEQVAYLHDVHPNTVRKYVKCGLIEKHPTSSHGKILIRASEALTLDFDELKKKSRVLIYREL